MLRLHILASGSRGNASVIEDAATGRAVLIDCGISKKDFMARCAEAAFDPARIEAILVTHEHTDHTKGLGVMLRGLAKLGARPDVFANPATFAASKPLQEIAETHRVLSFGADASGTGKADIGIAQKSGRPTELELAGMRIFPFVTSHDAAASFGFRIECDGDALGFMTDSGIVTPAAHDALQDVRLLALECNHDSRMLERGPYPYVVKQRIASDRGHLSNTQASDELAALLSNRLEAVAAMHISENNNEYDLALKTFAETLAREDHSARVCCGYQGRLTSIG
ncbi:MAG TPA: MBL fold metallo-hydrolase [Slackia equolifaciens]|uniref:MBL fold metallo-hydrolase n=1 Tax=Slackia equolifaciens TaxID=498718 RepID=A0A9D3A0T7_9ACTN|nr:MBL fold metallo-hydrolase [Slackia equolifaciens]